MSQLDRQRAKKSFFRKIDKWHERQDVSPGRIRRVYTDVHMGLGHKSLSEICLGDGIRTDNLDRGDYIIFINKAQTALKLFAAGNTIAYFKMPYGGKLDMGVVSLIPTFFNGDTIDYPGALSELIKRRGIQVA